MKYDLKKIMSIAWELKRLDDKNLFSECLKEAWKAAKRTTTIVKSWFISKNFSSDEAFIIGCADTSVVDITEKAMKLRFESDYGTITRWIPKSCLVSGLDELEEFIRDERQENGLKKYEKLLDWARENGLKVGNHPKKVNLIAKIKKAGLELPIWAM